MAVSALCAAALVAAFAVNRIANPESDPAAAAAAAQRLPVATLEDLRRTRFFDPRTHEPQAWYGVTPNGETRFYAADGVAQGIDTPLRPVSDAVIKRVERQLKTAEEAREDKEARRAATQRADAEIARARRRPIAVAAAVPPETPRQPAAAVTGAGREQPALVVSDRRGDARRESDVATIPSSRAAVRAQAAPDQPFNGTPPVTAGPMRERANAREMDDVDARTSRYDDLIRAARVLVDAGRFGEGRDAAQRALHVDPRRQEARALWAEAQTRLDARVEAANDGRRVR